MHSQVAPLPSPRQVAWQAMDTNAFVHFGPNTFTDVEWGGGKEDPNLFNPTALDCDQWVRAFKSAGFKGVVFTAKHHDGFCLWPSKLSKHTVAQSKWRDGQGDVLREISAACRRGGLKLGVYLSPWDRNHPAYGTPEYNDVFVGMLREVLTQYGPIFEVWFDGANGEGPNGKKQVYDWERFIRTVRECQPGAVIFSDAGPDIRWVGNEDGVGGETSWSTIPSGRYVPGTPLYKELTEGTRGADLWVPAEVDVSIRPGWFYHADQDSKVRSVANLMELYETSVGRNGLLLLNVPPDRRGLIADPDVRSLKEFGVLRKKVYGRDLARGARSTVTKGQYQFTLPNAATFDRVELREPIKKGQRIAGFTVEAEQGGVWKTIAKGTTVGNRRILKVPLTTAEALRVRIQDSIGEPLLMPIRLYLAAQPEAKAAKGELDGGAQSADGSLTLRAKGNGPEWAWSFEAIRGEVSVEVDVSGPADIEVELGGQTLRASATQSGTVKMGKAAIVVGGKTRLGVRVSGRMSVAAVRLSSADVG